MKREYYQVASVRRTSGPAARDRRTVRVRRQQLEDRPHSRDRHRSLYRALSRAGDHRRALELVEAWLRREPRSAEALALLAEAAGRAGQRRRAMRAMGSLIDLDPRAAALHRRLASIHDDAGQGRAACAHKITLAALSPGDRAAARKAADCRAGILSPALHAGRRVSGSVVLRGRWRHGTDLDLALVDSRGRRLTWLGSRRRIRFRQISDPGTEQLAWRWLRPGRYRIEVTRGQAAPVSVGVLRGSVTVRGPGLVRRIPFRLRGQRTFLAELTIKRKSRLVPAP